MVSWRTSFINWKTIICAETFRTFFKNIFIKWCESFRRPCHFQHMKVNMWLSSVDLYSRNFLLNLLPYDVRWHIGRMPLRKDSFSIWFSLIAQLRLPEWANSGKWIGSSNLIPSFDAALAPFSAIIEMASSILCCVASSLSGPEMENMPP